MKGEEKKKQNKTQKQQPKKTQKTTYQHATEWLLEHGHLHHPKLPAGTAAGMISRLCAKQDPVPTVSVCGYEPSRESYSAYAGPKGDPVRPNL